MAEAANALTVPSRMPSSGRLCAGDPGFPSASKARYLEAPEGFVYVAVQDAVSR